MKEENMANDPKTIRDLIKLRQLEVKLAEIRQTDKNNKLKKGRIKMKHLFIYLLPALLQVATVIGAYLAIVKSKLYEATNMYAEARNVKLQIDEDSLKGHKSKLNDSISMLGKVLQARQGQLNQFHRLNDQLRDTDKKLATDVQKKTQDLNNLGAAYCQNLIEKFPTQYNNFENAYIDELRRLAANPGNIKAIKILIDQQAITRQPDTAFTMANKLEMTALACFCLHTSAYRSEFLKNLRLYSSFFCRNFPGENYDNQLLNLIRYKRWTETEINENFGIIFDDAYKIYNKRQLAQIASWTTYRPFQYGNNGALKIIPPFWARQHAFLMEELGSLYLTSSLTTSDPNFLNYYKGIELSLLCECPQCYFALEATYLHQNFALFKSMNNTPDSMKMTVLMRKKNDQAEMYDNDATPKLKFFTLLRRDDIRAFSTKVLKVYDDCVANNQIVTFDRLGEADDFDGVCQQFSAYYSAKQERYRFWLDSKNADQSNAPAFQKRMLTLQL